MNHKQIKKLAMSAVTLVLFIALIWLIVALASRDPNAAGETVNSTKSTAFPYEDDNLEIEVEGDPDVDGEKDPPSPPNDDQNADSDGERDPAGSGDAATEETQGSGSDTADSGDVDSVISDDEADAYINADDFFS